MRARRPTNSPPARLDSPRAPAQSQLGVSVFQPSSAIQVTWLGRLLYHYLKADGFVSSSSEGSQIRSFRAPAGVNQAINIFFVAAPIVDPSAASCFAAGLYKERPSSPLNQAFRFLTSSPEPQFHFILCFHPIYPSMRFSYRRFISPSPLIPTSFV